MREARWTPTGCLAPQCDRPAEFAVEAGPSTFGACLYHLAGELLEPDGEGDYDGSRFTVRVLAKEEAASGGTTNQRNGGDDA